MKYILTIFICIFCVLQSFAANADTVLPLEKNTTSGVSAALYDTNRLKDEMNILLKQRLSGAEISSFRQIPKNGTVIYECDVLYQGSTVKLYINPKNGAVSPKIDDKDLFNDKITKTEVSRGTKELNNILKQIKLDASFSDVQYNKKDKIMEGNILYMDGKYYFKMNVATGEILEMVPIE